MSIHSVISTDSATETHQEDSDPPPRNCVCSRARVKRHSRSTVGTASDIHDFLRLLFARVGVPHCHKCGEPIVSHTVQQVVDRALEHAGATRLLICAPIAYDPAPDFRALLEDVRRGGRVRVRGDGELGVLP